MAAYPSCSAPFFDWVIYFCTGCGTGHVPGAAKLLGDYYNGAYSEEIAAYREIPPELYFAQGSRLIKRRHLRRADAQRKALRSQGARFNRVLDYGCGPGVFLHLANVRQPFAIEPDPKAWKYLDYLGVTRLSEADLTTQRFEVILAAHTVEHFTDTDVLARVKALIGALSQKGYLLIEVPWGGHTLGYPGGRQEPHTLFFTGAGLRALVTRAGGEIVSAFTRSNKPARARSQPIYRPPADDPFAATLNGGLTVIVRRLPRRVTR